MSMTVDELKAFEIEIAKLYEQGLIRAPVHLRSGREQALIDIFRDHKIGPDDYVFGYWDSHELALLKGVPREQLRQAILDGRSISLCFPEQKVFCSGIVGSLMGVATGAAWTLKHQGKPGRVYLFCGEMSSETGAFFEAVKYAHNFDLPVTFIVGDNEVSVMTKTRDIWGDYEPWFTNTRYASKIIYFKYHNEFPHSGLGKLIKF
jgi:TPP-dependent pyruvate/acetoin dehydrogenase alpha subunit